MAIRIGIVNRKGGVGKTTTSIILADAFTRLHKKTLLVDFDGQANCTSTYACEPTKTVADVMSGQVGLKDIIYKGNEMSDLVPSNEDLDRVKKSLTETGDQFRLREALDEVDKEYDIVIIDSNPSSDALTTNVLTAVDGVIIPSELETYSIDGILRLNNEIEKTKRYYNKSLKLYGILITDFDSKNSTQKRFNEVVKDFETVGIHVFNTYIRHSGAIPSVQQWRRVQPDTVSNKKIVNSKGSIFAYDGTNNAAQNYYDFAIELINRINEINK